MFDSRDEAINAVASKSTRAATDNEALASLKFKHFSAQLVDRVTSITFKKSQRCNAETLSELRDEFAQLGDSLLNDSRVVIDFTGLTEFCADSIEALAQLSRKLQSKGSRIALCNLSPDVKDAFFPNRKRDENAS
jgi:anti-anti-sigma regulatory factor